MNILYNNVYSLEFKVAKIILVVQVWTLFTLFLLNGQMDATFYCDKWKK